jgi:hypothetical protein
VSVVDVHTLLSENLRFAEYVSVNWLTKVKFLV